MSRGGDLQQGHLRAAAYAASAAELPLRSTAPRGQVRTALFTGPDPVRLHHLLSPGYQLRLADPNLQGYQLTPLTPLIRLRSDIAAMTSSRHGAGDRTCSISHWVAFSGLLKKRIGGLPCLSTL